MDSTGLYAIGPEDKLKIQPERPFDMEEAPSPTTLYSFGAGAGRPVSTSFDFEMPEEAKEVINEKVSPAISIIDSPSVIRLVLDELVER